MPPQQHLCNGVARPADYSICAWAGTGMDSGNMSALDRHQDRHRCEGIDSWTDPHSTFRDVRRERQGSVVWSGRTDGWVES